MILFSVFIIFLVVSLILSLQMLMNKLKKIVFRSKILIKIIPTEELRQLREDRIEQMKQDEKKALGI